MYDFKKLFKNENMNRILTYFCRMMNYDLVILYNEKGNNYFKTAAIREDYDFEDDESNNEFCREEDVDFSEIRDFILENKMSKNKWGEFTQYFKKAFDNVIQESVDELDELIPELFNYVIMNNLFELIGPSENRYNTITINEKGKEFIMHYLKRC